MTTLAQSTQDNSIRKYYYEFDLKMHDFTARVMNDLLLEGSILEVGANEGVFTERLIDAFDEVACAELDPALCDRIAGKLGNSVEIYAGDFEQALPRQKYTNVCIIHTLEHFIDDVRVLENIRENWLAPDGRLFIACPNANAASRRIAVEMGLLRAPDAVSDGERQHGHYRTYNMETLANSAKAAGFSVLKKGGIVFKALANFQIDEAMNTGCLDHAYLEGCFKLGFKYPDLCASVYIVCEAEG